jgi:acyl-coenzyme A thioesterase PaaI-like protein
MGIAVMPMPAPPNPNFKEDISASFAKLVLMHTIGAKIVRIEPGEVDVALPFRDDLTQQLGYVVIRSGRTLSICGGDVVAINANEERPIATMLATMMTVKE